MRRFHWVKRNYKVDVFDAKQNGDSSAVKNKVCKLKKRLHRHQIVLLGACFCVSLRANVSCWTAAERQPSYSSPCQRWQAPWRTGAAEFVNLVWLKIAQERFLLSHVHEAWAPTDEVFYLILPLCEELKDMIGRFCASIRGTKVHTKCNISKQKAIVLVKHPWSAQLEC